MHIHILGICGTFMGGIAAIAKELGFRVSGCDANVYPPMSTQLESLGIELMQGYHIEHLNEEPDMVIVGNAMARGNPMVEYVLDRNIPYTSGPQWLLEHVLKDRWVLAVSGTHGKTTTSSMLTWILEYAHMKPGYLIGGVPQNFDVSARLGESPFFVIEADEYDTAFFDKRSKFVHYRARTCVLNNLEFDHADIFADLAAIETQFHHLVRTIPQNGLIIHPKSHPSIERVLAKGCWTPTETFGTNFSVRVDNHHSQADWHLHKTKADGSQGDIYLKQKLSGHLDWPLIGDHNVSNALAAIAAVRHVGVSIEDALKALSRFTNVKRRMELRGRVAEITVYDDFAHHPTAIKSTVEGLRSKVGQQRIIAIVDPRSNTMRMGCHKETLINSVKSADLTIFHIPESYDWTLNLDNESAIEMSPSVDSILESLKAILRPHDHVLIMSNGSFDGIHQKLLDQLAQ